MDSKLGTAYVTVGIFVFSTYLASTAKAEVMVGCILAYICKNVEVACQYSMLSIFGMWQPYLYIQWYISNMYTMLLVEWLMSVIFF